MAAPARPYLSLVVTARNDDHGGNLLRRMQIFVSGWIAQARRHGLASELVIVEWNPVRDRPPLRDALKWPREFGPCEVRFIEVNAELHRRFRFAEALPLYQMIAKNVGIRRARGEFILATNIDILFSDELVAFLAERRLDGNRMYRIDRLDAMSDVPEDATVEEQLEYCRTHLIRRNAREGTFPLTSAGRNKVVPGDDIVSPDSGIAFERGWYPVERHGTDEIFRFSARTAEIDLVLRPWPAVLCLELEPGPGMTQKSMSFEFVDNEGASGTASIRARSMVRLLLPDGSDARTLRISVRDVPEPLENDPRPLCFRAFSCRWAPRPRSTKRLHGRIDIEVTTLGILRLVTRFTRQLNTLIARIAEGGPLVTVTFPVSQPLKRLAMAYGRLVSGRPPLNAAPPSVPLMAPGSAPVASPLPDLTGPTLLHANACGDFTLLSRQKWFDLRGYPEFDLFSMNIDSVFCYSAHYGGAAEEVLREPLRIYHIEHGAASGWTPEGEKMMYERLRGKGIPWLDNSEVLRWASWMRRLNCPFVFNHEDWGFADLPLPETRLPVEDVQEPGIAD